MVCPALTPLTAVVETGEFGEQTKGLGEAYTKAAAGAVKAPFKTSLE
jgi:hypothetical protein